MPNTAADCTRKGMMFMLLSLYPIAIREFELKKFLWGGACILVTDAATSKLFEKMVEKNPGIFLSRQSAGAVEYNCV
jgi:hypothetical protein